MADGSRDSDTFWPGYVDAISNLVLSLLFIVAILTIAVFMFAMELGRRQVILQHKTVEQTTRKVAAAGSRPPREATPAEQKAALEAQIRTLRQEMKVLRAASAKLSARRENEGGARTPPKTLTASEKASAPEKVLQGIQPRPGGIVIVFAADAVALTSNEAGKAKEALGVIRDAGAASIEVLVPTGFSEVKRLAFYRAMAVRNLLIELGIASDRIEVGLTEVQSGGDSARVFVRAR